jgi:hypothetical protein
MQVRELVLNKLETLHLIFRGYRSHGGFGSWFRGQADADWDLLPKAGRPEHFLPDNRDLGRFHAWRNQAIAYSTLPAGELDQVAIAQHHGLATRLLDWSGNPLVACFFACWELPDRDAAVYILEAPEQLFQIGTELATLREVSGVYGYLPNPITPRVLNQKGLFTVHCDAATPVSVRSSSRDATQSNLNRILIPRAMKQELLKMVSDYGVDRSMLFPDLDGLSWHINGETRNMAHRAAVSLKVVD